MHVRFLFRDVYDHEWSLINFTIEPSIEGIKVTPPYVNKTLPHARGRLASLVSPDHLFINIIRLILHVESAMPEFSHSCHYRSFIPHSLSPSYSRADHHDEIYMALRFIITHHASPPRFPSCNTGPFRCDRKGKWTRPQREGTGRGELFSVVKRVLIPWRWWIGLISATPDGKCRT